jgi:predicted secreted Zn-dependent protease
MKQSQNVETQTSKRTKPESQGLGDTMYPVEQSNLFNNLAYSNGNGSVEAQTTWLGDSRLQNAQRQALAAQIGQRQGNQHLQMVVASMGHGVVQLDGNPKKKSANPGGKGPGRMQNATESYYTVSGPTLDSITGQLNQAGGWGAQTETDLGIVGTVTPTRQEDGTYRAQVQWTITSSRTLLPQWSDYDSACKAAQNEWDRFMRQTRLHEQTAHVNMARDFVKNLGEADTVITGSTVDELRENLQAKQVELAERLQAEHDDCGHGADVDAILHPERGVCEEESETAP